MSGHRDMQDIGGGWVWGQQRMQQNMLLEMNMEEIEEGFECHTGGWTIGKPLEEFTDSGWKGNIVQLSYLKFTVATK